MRPGSNLKDDKLYTWQSRSCLKLSLPSLVRLFIIRCWQISYDAIKTCVQIVSVYICELNSNSSGDFPVHWAATPRRLQALHSSYRPLKVLRAETAFLKGHSDFTECKKDFRRKPAHLFLRRSFLVRRSKCTCARLIITERGRKRGMESRNARNPK